MPAPPGFCSFPGCILRDRHPGLHAFLEHELAASGRAAKREAAKPPPPAPPQVASPVKRRDGASGSSTKKRSRDEKPQAVSMPRRPKPSVVNHTSPQYLDSTTVDQKLWPGAAMAGWRVQARGNGTSNMGHYWYIHPSGERFHTKAAASDAALLGGGDSFEDDVANAMADAEDDPDVVERACQQEADSLWSLMTREQARTPENPAQDYMPFPVVVSPECLTSTLPDGGDISDDDLFGSWLRTLQDDRAVTTTTTAGGGAGLSRPKRPCRRMQGDAVSSRSARSSGRATTAVTTVAAAKQVTATIQSGQLARVDVSQATNMAELHAKLRHCFAVRSAQNTRLVVDGNLVDNGLLTATNISAASNVYLALGRRMVPRLPTDGRRHPLDR